MSDTAPREASTPSRWAAPSLIALVFLNMLGFGIVVPLLPFYAKSFNSPAWQVSLIGRNLTNKHVFFAAPDVPFTGNNAVRELPALYRAMRGSSTRFAPGEYFLGWIDCATGALRALRAVLQRRSDQAQMLLRSHIEESKAEVRKITLHMLHDARASAA